MARRRLRFPVGVVFVGLFSLALFLFLVPSRYTTRINYLFVKITSPVLNLFPKSVRFRDDMVSRQEYDDIVTAYAKTHAQLLRLRGDYSKVSGLHQSLPEIEGQIMMGKVVRTSLIGGRSELVIDKGADDRLQVGQYVLSCEPYTVIGTISEVVEGMARVRLVTDRRQHLAVSILGKGSRDYLPGQLQGKNSEIAKIPLRSQKKYDIRVGDVVYASPQPGFLGLEVIVGNISEVKPDDREPLLWDISVKPIEDFSRLTDVAILVMDPESNGLSNHE
ncbi:MAG: hypothetical protein FVQ79_13975 [Planctomycetes bacterium]|nr:hypothetical protein [Planctomycetota bacterium]